VVFRIGEYETQTVDCSEPVGDSAWSRSARQSSFERGDSAELPKRNRSCRCHRGQTGSVRGQTGAARCSADNRSRREPLRHRALWRQGDFVARGTLIILMIMSVGSWYIGIIKVLEQRRMLKDAKEADEKFWHEHSVKEGVATLKEDSAFRFVAERARSRLRTTPPCSPSSSTSIPGSAWPCSGRSTSSATACRAVSRSLRRWARPRVRRLVRDRVGHLPRAHRDRHRGAGIDRQGRRSRGRGADHDGARSGGGRAGGARLQLLVRRNRVAMELIRHFGGGVHMSLLGRGGRTRADSES